MWMPAVVIMVAIGTPILPSNAVSQNEHGTSNPELEDIATNLLEELRRLMLYGKKGFPVMDPIQLENVTIHGDSFEVPGLTLSFADFELRNLSTFVIHTLNVISVMPLLKYSVDFDASILKLDFRAKKYILYLQTEAFRMFGQGKVNFQMVQLSLAGYIVLGIRMTKEREIFVQILNSDVRARLGQFKSNLTGMFGNESANEFVNISLERLVPDLIEHFEKEISDFINMVTLHIVNDIVHDMDLSDIFGSALLV